MSADAATLKLIADQKQMQINSTALAEQDVKNKETQAANAVKTGMAEMILKTLKASVDSSKQNA